uniref:Uncharacterized protein n=1 Tax=Anguilla anguilla TaxID=7936 RepID=A0A0E9XM82_ANGAN
MAASLQRALAGGPPLRTPGSLLPTQRACTSWQFQGWPQPAPPVWPSWLALPLDIFYC